MPGLPASLRLPNQSSNTPRAQITNFDKTHRGFFNIDYNHAFSAAGAHTLKGGFGFQSIENTVNAAYPGGYVFLFWDAAFTFACTSGRVVMSRTFAATRQPSSAPPKVETCPQPSSSSQPATRLESTAAAMG